MSKHDLKSRLEQSYTEVNDIFSRVEADQWQTTVFSDGEWSAHDLLRHIVTSEYSMNGLIQSIVDGGAGAPDDLDIDRFNRGQIRKQQERTVDELMSMMGKNHQRTKALLDSLSDEELTKRGRHGGLGQETSVRTIFKIIAGHNLQHAQDVQEALAN